MTPQLLHRPPEQEQQDRDQQQEATAANAQQTPDTAGPTVEIETGRELSLPPNATPAEAAAIAAAMSAHLSAQDTAATDQQTPDFVSNWTVARQLGAGRNVRHLPRAENGDAWKLAGRLH